LPIKYATDYIFLYSVFYWRFWNDIIQFFHDLAYLIPFIYFSYDSLWNKYDGLEIFTTIILFKLAIIKQFNDAHHFDFSSDFQYTYTKKTVRLENLICTQTFCLISLEIIFIFQTFPNYIYQIICPSVKFRIPSCWCWCCGGKLQGNLYCFHILMSVLFDPLTICFYR
jgi:hypothetical protein